MPALRPQTPRPVRYFNVFRTTHSVNRNENGFNLSWVQQLPAVESLRNLVRWLKEPNSVVADVHIRKTADRLISATREKVRPFVIEVVRLSLLAFWGYCALLSARITTRDREMRRRKVNLWVLKRFPTPEGKIDQRLPEPAPPQILRSSEPPPIERLG